MEMGQTVVLVAEDEAMVRSLVAISLESGDFCVVQAADSEEALQLARAHNHIDLLLADVQMCQGSLNGIELAERIIREKPGVKVLVMSGFPENEHLAIDRGFPFLAKPFTPDGLTQRVRQVLSKVPAKTETAGTERRKAG